MDAHSDISWLRNFIQQSFDSREVKDAKGQLAYEAHTSKVLDSKKLERFFENRFGRFVKEVEEKKLDYQIVIRTKPMLVVEETVGKTLVVYSDGTVWLNMLKDLQEANRILQFISAKIEKAGKKDLIKLCGGRGLSRWSYIKRATKAKPEEFKNKIKELLNSKHYVDVETRSILGSFGVKYREQRSMKIVPTNKRISIQIAIKDIFCQDIDLLKIPIDFLSL